MATHPATRARRAAPETAPEPPQEVKDRIYSAALELFAAKGYSAVSVREICRQARTTPPMVYYYFESKRGLYQSILRESLQWRRRDLDKAVRCKGDPLTRLRLVIEAYTGLGQEPAMRDLRLFFLRELFGLGSEIYKQRVDNFDRAFRHAVKAVLQEGVEQGVFRPVKTEMVVLAISGILNTFSRRMALGAPLRLEDGVEQVMDTVIYGLAPREAPAGPTAALAGSGAAAT